MEQDQSWTPKPSSLPAEPASAIALMTPPAGVTAHVTPSPRGWAGPNGSLLADRISKSDGVTLPGRLQKMVASKLGILFHTCPLWGRPRCELPYSENYKAKNWCPLSPARESLPPAKSHMSEPTLSCTSSSTFCSKVAWELPVSAIESAERRVYGGRLVSIDPPKRSVCILSQRTPPSKSKANQDQFYYLVFRFKDNNRKTTKTSTCIISSKSANLIPDRY